MKKLSIFLLLSTALSNFTVFAQISDFVPKPAYAFPAGGEIGTTVQVFIHGQKMKNCEVLINDSKIDAEIINSDFDRVRSIEPEARNAIRDLTKAIKGIGQLNDDIRKALPNWAEFYPYKQKSSTPEDDARVLYKFASERERVRPSAEFAETLLVKLKIPKNVKLGRKELRLKNYGGISRPIYFFVGKLPEIFEQEPKTDNQVQTVKPLALPVCVNGQIYPGDFDIIQFEAKKGKTIEISAIARELRPFIADGVPGWFEAKLTLFSPSGKIIKYSDCDSFRPDPRTVFRVPETGVYSVEIRDNIYRGREDFVYRLEISDYKPKQLPNFSHTILKTGQINRHKFTAQKGQKISIRTNARKLGSPLDTFIQIVDKKGNILAQNDDAKLAHRIGLHTVFCDSNLVFEAPEEGEYAVQVSDTLQHGGKEYGYNLEIKPATADFAVYTTTSCLSTISGFGTMITFKAERYNDLAGDIKIKVKGDNQPFWLEEAIIPAGAAEVSATLFVSNEFKGREKELKFVAYSENATEKAIDVTPADDWEQAFLWRHLVPADRFLATITKARAFAPYFLNKTEETIKIGDKKSFTAKYKSSDPTFDHSQLSFYLKKAPKGVTLSNHKYESGFLTLTFSVEEKIKTPGNIIIDKTITKQFTRNEKKREVKHSLGTLPPLPYKL